MCGRSGIEQVKVRIWAMEHGIEVRPRGVLPRRVVEMYLQACQRDGGDAGARPDDDDSATFAPKVVVVVERCDGKVTIRPVHEGGVQVSIFDLDWHRVENGDVGYISAMLRKADRLLPPDSPGRRHLLAALGRRLGERARLSREEPGDWDIEASSLVPQPRHPAEPVMPPKREPQE